MSAVISPCGRYRYRLDRVIGQFGPVAAVIMVNPSTADAERDDATIRRLIGFGKRFCWSRVVVGNVFAYRATDIRELSKATDPIGPQNSVHLRTILAEADVAVVAWGPLAKLPNRLRDQWKAIYDFAQQAQIGLCCLGMSKDGHPRHPLMLNYSSRLIEWKAP